MNIAEVYMSKNKMRCMAVFELIYLSVEGVLIVGGLHRSVVTVIAVLMADLFLISPMKCGRALWFDTLCADPENADLALFFRYYRHCYFRAIWWRIQLWSRMVLWVSVYACPIVAVAVIQKTYATDERLWIICQLCSCFFTIVALMLTLFQYLKYRPSVTLLLYTKTVTKAFQTSAQLFKQDREKVLQPYREVIKKLPLFVLILPILVCSWAFHLDFAENIRVFALEFQKEYASPLETGEKTWYHCRDINF